jgi:hypothetical protein
MFHNPGQLGFFNDFSVTLKALGDETRFKIVQLLLKTEKMCLKLSDFYA